MSERIIQEWKLAVLRVTLELRGAEPKVRSRLDGFVQGEAVPCWERTDPLPAFGLGSSDEIPDSVRVPRPLQSAVTRSMRDELPPQSALWIRLEPPYGFLGAAPWEDLVEQIHVPVLRVPDRLPAQAQFGDTWRIALIASTPGRARWGADHVRTFSAALQAAVDRGELADVEIEVFPNLTVFHQLEDFGAPIVRIHDPQKFSRQPRRRPVANRVAGTRRISSEADPRLAWSEWITATLDTTTSSALHVVGQGVPKMDFSMLEMSADPAAPQSAHTPATADANDLWALADVLGASLVSIAAPEKTGNDVGARMVADRLGQLRPGPTAFSSIRLDPQSHALARLHSFLARQRENELPESSSWFGYIQPESIRHTLADPLLPRHTNQVAPPPPAQVAVAGRVALESEPFAPTAAISDSLRGESEVPRWAASSSRFIETRIADISNDMTGGGHTTGKDDAYDLGASKALADIQRLVQKHLGGSP